MIFLLKVLVAIHNAINRVVVEVRLFHSAMKLGVVLVVQALLLDGRSADAARCAGLLRYVLHVLLDRLGRTGKHFRIFQIVAKLITAMACCISTINPTVGALSSDVHSVLTFSTRCGWSPFLVYIPWRAYVIANRTFLDSVS